MMVSVYFSTSNNNTISNTDIECLTGKYQEINLSSTSSPYTLQKWYGRCYSWRRSSLIEEMWTTGGHGIGFMKDVIRISIWCYYRVINTWYFSLIVKLILSYHHLKLSPPIVEASTFVATVSWFYIRCRSRESTSLDWGSECQVVLSKTERTSMMMMLLA